MGDDPTALVWIRDHRLARLATSATQAWLWRTDFSGLLWANAAGGACFGVTEAAALASRRLAATDPRIAQIARLAGTLYPGGRPRLERLRGLGTGIGRAAVYASSRIIVADTAGFLIVAQEFTGPVIPLPERVRYLLAGSDEPAAAFSPEGRFVAATPSGRGRIGSARTLAAIGGDTLAIAALAEGVAAGDTPLGRISVIRLGHDDSTVLLATFSARPHYGAIDHADWEHPAAGARGGYAREARDTEAAAVAEETPGLFLPAPIAGGAMPPQEPATAASDAAEPTPLRIEPSQPDRRTPLRFVWQMDPSGRFTLGSDEFVEAIGPRTATVLGRPWMEIAAELGLDPDDEVQRAIETRDTWSGITVGFPTDGSVDRVQVELSGLPVYDRNRNFLGYRGFGVCRDIDRLTRSGWRRRAPGPTASAPAPDEATESLPGEAAPADIGQSMHDRPAAPADTGQSVQDRPAAPADTGTSAHDQPASRGENVVPFPAAAPEPKPGAGEGPASTSAALSAGEHNAFREIARRLQAGLSVKAQPVAGPADPGAVAPSDGTSAALGAFLDGLPVGFLVYRFDQPLHANRAFLDATGFSGFDALVEAGGLDGLSVHAEGGAPGKSDQFGQRLTILANNDEKTPIAARLFPVPWLGESAVALMLVPGMAQDRSKSAELAVRRAETHIRELRSILDTAFDGVVVLSRDGRIVSANRSAEALFGYEPDALDGTSFADLFVPQSQGPAREYFDRLCRGGGIAGEGREVIGQSHYGQAFPLSITMGAMPDGADMFYAVFRDLTPWKKVEQGLLTIRREADRAGAAQAELLAKLSHGVRDPLNSILGFADLMLEERFGPLANERYRGYLQDIRAAARHIVGLFDDVLNLSRAEAGTLELAFVPVDLNALVQSCVKAMQMEASRERIILRSSLSPRLNRVVAHDRSLQQIIGNLLSNAISHAGAGGQVIVSTTQTERGHVVLRMRSTLAHGKSTEPAAVAPDANAPPGAPSDLSGAGVDLVLTKALAEANRGTLNVSSRANDGTLFEVSFPVARIPAE